MHVRAVERQGSTPWGDGELIPFAMRIVHLTHDAEALARLRLPAEAMALIRQRSGRAYDAALVT